MLDHRDPAVVGLRRELGLSSLDIAEADLLELLLVGEDGWTGEGRHHRTLAVGCLDIALQLIVRVCYEFLLAGVLDLVLQPDQITAALERVDLGHPDTVACFRFEAQNQFLGIIAKFAFARSH
ncbi:MAG: hypothetical protein AW07_01521 [Candidatus Accumulibacter sp. SK-11]|nr:MAG: hypothetical protein AW07_01521 [Candidatus Accumulibacter sp. SK-11]